MRLSIQEFRTMANGKPDETEIGGLGFVPIIGYKLVRAFVCVWKYGNISSLVP